ncbi:hypothetical protein W97_02439 [Coniosporium apollinis CBS 100218]|uniref:PNPLA domain-containing protein n=1 Tax=Coniosporium apollinis (strain CBS 100218) TaxID=1168221 RepID=R7YMT2_CONA1|nr:uncharacterized protein W97_02439 [Coniosporium apollinis CBS 100218]EON63212.1 hypothetical protein W97_02439 [Coniosporium apollinis CBS 100218]
MADANKATDGPLPFAASAYDFTQLPDYDDDFVDEEHFDAFVNALSAPENTSPSQEDLGTPNGQPQSVFITALNDWRPIHQRVRSRRPGKKQRPPRRGVDETREGFVYTLLKWPLLFTVFGWLIFLGISYLLTRVYIYLYEHFVTWRGKRERLRRALQSKSHYEEWVDAAKELDTYLGNDEWKAKEEYAYYDSKTVRRVRDQMARLRAAAGDATAQVNGEHAKNISEERQRQAVEDLRSLVEACVKSNWSGTENPHLYSETYFGTKHLVQSYFDQVSASLELLSSTPYLSQEAKHNFFKHLSTNYGRTALCLSGGATFAYYHFGVAKALMDASLLPTVITGTSGGALVAALLATRTDDELKRLLVPALANRITACHDDILTWLRRWWATGARFDAVDWAKRCAWFCHGSLTFREAYQRTGRILNVTCVPSDPHSPTILANYITSPDCVIWSAVLASAAVPGILNPVVLMKKRPDGKLEPYSFGHKWKDGSLRTDIPLKALNLHFNVRFSIVSQVNPHINLFFFSSRGSVGRPVTHRRGRGWRGGFLGSATEQYLKLDLTKWLKVLRHLELLPRPLGQDWSEIWLQRFSGTITIWPKSIPSDFVHILSDPSPERLARMIYVGQQSAFPKLQFIANRMRVERLIERGRRSTREKKTPATTPAAVDGLKSPGLLANILSEDDLRDLLRRKEKRERRPRTPATQHQRLDNGGVAPPPFAASPDSGSSTSLSGSESESPEPSPNNGNDQPPPSPSISKRLSDWWKGSPSTSRTPSALGVPRKRHSIATPISHTEAERPHSMFELGPPSRKTTGTEAGQQQYPRRRRGSFLQELERQTSVFFDDADVDDEGESEGEGNQGDGEGDAGQEVQRLGDVFDEAGEEAMEAFERSEGRDDEAWT